MNKTTFEDSHIAGNDSIATLNVAKAMILDPETDDYYDYPDDPDNDIIHTGVSMETRLQRPLKHMDTNVITLCLISKASKV